MKPRTRNILIIAALVLLPFLVFGHPPVYFAKSISGQVVDDETGKPLAGVFIVAQWVLFQPGIGHGGHVDQTMNIIEVVTDQNGKYFIPGWGPRPRPPLLHLDHRDPTIYFFKSQYGAIGYSNDPKSYGNSSTVRTSEWDGKVIQLKPARGSLEDYAAGIGHVYGLNRKDWKSFPRMVLALDAEAKRLKSLGVKDGRWSVMVLRIEDLGESDRAYLKGFEK